jgi:quercetin dioxygenase-like cupin family protein
MIRRLSALATERKSSIHGGAGAALTADYLANGEMDGVVTAGRVVLEPGAGIGEHPHPNHDELYLVVEGHGTGILDGEQFPIAAGDMYLLKAGQSHGMVNDSDQALAFFMLMTKSGSSALGLSDVASDNE